MGSTCLFWRSQRVDERRRICVVEIGYWPFLDSSVPIHYVCCWINIRLFLAGLCPAFVKNPNVYTLKTDAVNVLYAVQEKLIA